MKNSLKHLQKTKAFVLDVAKKEGVLEDAIGWARYFGEDLENLPLTRFAQHVKAALTKLIKSKEDSLRIFAIMDKINLMIYGHHS